jgi:hypothetical protein
MPIALRTRERIATLYTTSANSASSVACRTFVTPAVARRGQRVAAERTFPIVIPDSLFYRPM